MTIVLGIETSCDDTAASILKNGSIASNIVKCNRETLNLYGGVVPELSARAHQEYIKSVVEQALQTANVEFRDIDLIAITSGPGLLRSLLVGTSFAKILALTLNKPILGINHLEGHLLSGHIQHDISFPFIGLLISGGHTMIVLAEKFGKYKIIGQTVDDSAGEAFDKISQMLKLDSIGGAAVEQYAKQGNIKTFKLPRPMIHSGDLNFSFAGLKTAIKNLIHKISPVTLQQKYDICKAAQQAISDTIVKKIQLTFTEWCEKYPNHDMTLVTVGGVASNKTIRQNLQDCCDQYHIKHVLPHISLCTDNAAMIAYVAHLKAQHKPALLEQSPQPDLAINTLPIWPLQTL